MLGSWMFNQQMTVFCFNLKKIKEPKASVLGPDQTTTTVSGQDGPWERCFVVPNLPNAVPHVGVIPNHKIILLLLCNCNCATVMNCKYLM